LAKGELSNLKLKANVLLLRPSSVQQRQLAYLNMYAKKGAHRKVCICILSSLKRLFTGLQTNQAEACTTTKNKHFFQAQSNIYLRHHAD
jgi:hypothetical protein